MDPSKHCNLWLSESTHHPPCRWMQQNTSTTSAARMNVKTFIPMKSRVPRNRSLGHPRMSCPQAWPRCTVSWSRGREWWWCSLRPVEWHAILCVRSVIANRGLTMLCSIPILVLVITPTVGWQIIDELYFRGNHCWREKAETRLNAYGGVHVSPHRHARLHEEIICISAY